MMTLRVVEPTFAGNDSFVQVGRRKYGLPPGTQINEPHKGKLVYVLLHDGSVHALTPKGEIPLPEDLARLIAAKVFGEPGHA